MVVVVGWEGCSGGCGGDGECSGGGGGGDEGVVVVLVGTKV